MKNEIVAPDLNELIELPKCLTRQRADIFRALGCSVQGVAAEQLRNHTI